MLVGLLLLVSSAILTLPAMIGMKTLMVAPSLLSFSSLFASFVLLVSSASIAVFLQLAVLSLTRWRRRRRSSPAARGASSASSPLRSASTVVPVSPPVLVVSSIGSASTVVPVSPPVLVVSSIGSASTVVPVSPPVLVVSSIGSASTVVPVSPPVLVVSSVRSGGEGRRSLRLVPFLLAALALLPGCTQAPAAQAAAPAACDAAAPGQVVANAALQDGKASPAPHRVSVPLGSQVRLGVSVDTAAQIHVHGYDLEYAVQPGQPMCIVFVASQSGLFDVEAHPDTLLLQLEVK